MRGLILKLCCSDTLTVVQLMCRSDKHMLSGLWVQWRDLRWLLRGIGNSVPVQSCLPWAYSPFFVSLHFINLNEMGIYQRENPIELLMTAYYQLFIEYPSGKMMAQCHVQIKQFRNGKEACGKANCCSSWTLGSEHQKRDSVLLCNSGPHSGCHSERTIFQWKMCACEFEIWHLIDYLSLAFLGIAMP